MLANGQPDFLGFGIVTPFQRDAKNDFANDGGAELLRSCVGQILGVKCDGPTTSGELLWRTEFGSLLHQIRQRNNSVQLRELARAYIQDAIARWEPRIQITRVVPIANPFKKNQIALLVAFIPIERATANSGVVLPEQTVTVPLGA